MSIFSKRIIRSTKYTLYAIALIVAFICCEKEEKGIIPPVIEFIKDSGYVYSDTSIGLGTTVKVGIKAVKSGTNITYLYVKVDNGTISTALDSGMNTSAISYTRSILKSNNQYEVWTFTVMDKDHNMSSVSLKLLKKAISIYGDINYYPSIILGAQNNTTVGSFYSLASNTTYNQTEAFNNQQLIDIIYYYGQYQATLSSPNEAEVPLFYTGATGISNYTIMNETRYDTTLVTTQMFDSSNNDSLLLAEYDQINGKKKAKTMQSGMVVSFRNAAGKIGILKVISVNGTDAGTIEIAIKVQK